METMASKWPGRCKRCGVSFPTGTPIVWSKETGATHVTDDACAEAMIHPPPGLRGPQPEQPEDVLRAEYLLLSHPWKFARTMASIPHWYTLRKQWDVDDDFVWIIEHIRRVGYEQQFGRKVYTYYALGEHEYWDCGGDLYEMNAKTGYYLLCGINRAVRKVREPRLFEEPSCA